MTDGSPRMDAAGSGAPRQDPAAPGPDSSPTRPRVLAVDDSPTQLLRLQFALEGAGFEVATAADGALALEAVRDRVPDVVVSDIVMPGVDGYELCRALRADPALAKVPVILATGLAAPEDVLRGLDCGADGFITKPYEADILVAQVHQVLDDRTEDGDRDGWRPGGLLYGGRVYLVNADPKRTLALLLSTYANAVHQNAKLMRAQEDLRAANERLEEKVRQRTAELAAEVSRRTRGEAEQLHLATHDATTGLANGRLCIEWLRKAIAGAERHRHAGAVLFLDLDGFKAVNDVHGHEAGDAVLREVAGRLLGAVRESDLVGRYAGDEFLVVLPRLEDPEDATLAARRIIEAISAPFEVDGRWCTVGVSVGISTFLADGSNPEELIRRADDAMYEVKAAGRNGFRFHRATDGPEPGLRPDLS